jgi:hypothetical protein
VVRISPLSVDGNHVAKEGIHQMILICVGVSES